MEQDTTYVALDDSKRKIVADILRPGATQPELGELPNDPHHIRRLFERLTREGPVMACYEAGVSGYHLYRQITTLAVPCQVMAPALIPRRPGQRIKTNRRDAGKLVYLSRSRELTAIHVPDQAEEAVRDLVRCRDDVRRDVPPLAPSTPQVAGPPRPGQAAPDEPRSCGSALPDNPRISV